MTSRIGSSQLCLYEMHEYFSVNQLNFFFVPCFGIHIKVEIIRVCGPNFVGLDLKSNYDFANTHTCN